MQEPNVKSVTPPTNPSTLSETDLYIALPVAAAVIIGILVAVLIVLKKGESGVGDDYMDDDKEAGEERGEQYEDDFDYD